MVITLNICTTFKIIKTLLQYNMSSSHNFQLSALNISYLINPNSKVRLHLQFSIHAEEFSKKSLTN
jgi:bifunctional pyridoxal-dependent enzyme with beta-cystathionase and maltose regulon repressor activities